MSLRLVPISLDVANEHIAAWHRHNKPVVQCIFRVGAADDEGILRSVAIVENPKARGNAANGETVEITRLASDGTKNACSILYGACARAAFALGYLNVITYIQDDEPGTSLKAAGYPAGCVTTSTERLGHGLSATRQLDLSQRPSPTLGKGRMTPAARLALILRLLQQDPPQPVKACLPPPRMLEREDD